jgi:L-aspartate oxidase
LVQPILARGVGVTRNREGLRAAAATLLPLASSGSVASEPAIVGLLIAIAALRREESRGAHFREDFPQHATHARRSCLNLDEAFALAREITAPSAAFAWRA